MPSPESEGKIAKIRELVYAWKGKYSDYVSFQVIVELKNVGTGWAKLDPFDSDYTVLDKSGGVVTTGSFTYAYPEYVAPGGVAYLAEDGSELNGAVADYVKVEVDGRYGAVDSAGATLSVGSIRLKSDSFEGGLIATGFVTNTSSVAVDEAALAVICLNASGIPIGATTTNLLKNLAPGQKKGFETVTSTPPLRASQCTKVAGYAMDAGY